VLFAAVGHGLHALDERLAMVAEHKPEGHHNRLDVVEDLVGLGLLLGHHMAHAAEDLDVAGAVGGQALDDVRCDAALAADIAGG